MRTLLTEDFLRIPEGVTVDVKARKITVKGQRGEVSKDFGHLSCEIQKLKQDNKKRQGSYIRVRMWLGSAKRSCTVNTLKSHINSMIVGVREVSPESDFCSF